MSKRTTLLLVVADFGYGGPTKSLLGLLSRIDTELFDVTVVALSDEGGLRRYFVDDVRLQSAGPIVSALALRPHTVKADLGHLLMRPPMLRAALRALYRHRFHSAIMNQERQKLWIRFGPELDPLPGSFDVAIAFGGAFTHYYTNYCVRAIKKYHSVISDYRIISLDRNAEEICFSAFDGALAVSQGTAAIFNAEFPALSSRTRVVANYVPQELYEAMPSDCDVLVPRSADTVRVVTVSRLDRLKGVELAVEACARLAEVGIAVDWYVLGDGPERDRLARLARDLGIGENMHFTGYLDNPYSIVKECDILVHPSRSEGRSVAVDEAQFLGVPVVATEYPTVRDQIEDGLTGVVAPFGGDGLAHAVLDLLADTDLRARLRSNTRGVSPGDLNGDLSDLLHSLR